MTWDCAELATPRVEAHSPVPLAEADAPDDLADQVRVILEDDPAAHYM